MVFEKGPKIGMLRVFQIAVVLMGGLLMMMTLGMYQRDRAENFQQLLVTEYRLFSRNGILYSFSLWLVQPETGHRILLVEAEDDWKVIGWAADGALIYEVASHDESPVLMGVKQNGRGRRILAEATMSNYGQAVWLTPNRERAIILEDKTHWITSVRTNGSGRVRLGEFFGEGYFLHSVSPDSQWVALGMYPSPSVFWMRVDGRELRELAPDGKDRTWPVAWVSFGDGLIVASHWKDYTHLYWLNPATMILRRITNTGNGIEDYIGANNDAGLVLVKTQLSGNRSSTISAVDGTTGDMVWSVPSVTIKGFSPDYRWGLMKSSDIGWQRLDTATGETFQISATFIDVDDLSPQWSPDNRWVVFSFTNSPTGMVEIWRLELASGEIHQIFEREDISGVIAWDYDSHQLYLYHHQPGKNTIASIDLNGGSFQDVTNPALYNDPYVESVAPSLAKKTWSKSWLLLSGMALIVLGIVPTILRLRARSIRE